MRTAETRRAAGWLLGVRPYALLTGLCVLLYLPGLATIPPLDRDEARFAQATRQMLETGDFLRIRFQGEARNKKPAGIYWLQAAAVAGLSNAESTAIWPYRLPSSLAAGGAALLLFAFGSRLFPARADALAPRRSALAAAVLLASALGVVAEAHIAKTDAVLLAAVTAGQGALGLAYVRARAGRAVGAGIAAAFWAGEVAAILLKGPVGPALALATVLTLWIADGNARWLRALHPIAGIVGAAIILVPWLLAIQHATAGHFLADSLAGDLATKLIGAQESHGAPPFSYLLLSFATFWPGSLLLVPALLRAWRQHERPTERFLLAWLVPAWVFLELVPTKLPHYVLPLYPALALLAGAALVDVAPALAGGWARRGAVAGRALWVFFTLALAALMVGAPLRFAGRLMPAGLIGAAAVVAVAAALLRSRRGIAVRTMLLAALSLAFVLPTALGVLPGLDRLWLSRSAAGLVASHPPGKGARLVAVGYGEPSLVFLLGTDLRIATPRGAAETLGDGGEALVSSREQPMFLQALAARGLVAQPLGSVPGVDYSNGERLVLTLYNVRPG